MGGRRPTRRASKWAGPRSPSERWGGSIEAGCRATGRHLRRRREREEPTPSGRDERGGKSADQGPRRVPTDLKPLPPELAAEIRRAADVATTLHREALVTKMTQAVAAYDRGRYQEAARLAKQVGDETPSIPAVRQVAGLAAYRSGRWREAIRQLGAPTAS